MNSLPSLEPHPVDSGLFKKSYPKFDVTLPGAPVQPAALAFVPFAEKLVFQKGALQVLKKGGEVFIRVFGLTIGSAQITAAIQAAITRLLQGFTAAALADLAILCGVAVGITSSLLAATAQSASADEPDFQRMRTALRRAGFGTSKRTESAVLLLASHKSKRAAELLHRFETNEINNLKFTRGINELLDQKNASLKITTDPLYSDYDRANKQWHKRSTMTLDELRHSRDMNEEDRLKGITCNKKLNIEVNATDVTGSTQTSGQHNGVVLPTVSFVELQTASKYHGQTAKKYGLGHISVVHGEDGWKPQPSRATAKSYRLVDHPEVTLEAESITGKGYCRLLNGEIIKAQ